MLLREEGSSSAFRFMIVDGLSAGEDWQRSLPWMSVRGTECLPVVGFLLAPVGYQPTPLRIESFQCRFCDTVLIHLNRNMGQALGFCFVQLQVHCQVVQCDYSI